MKNRNLSEIKTEGFHVFSYLGPLCLVCVFGVFSPVCFELSVAVQLIACKHSSLKQPIVCRVGLYALTPLHDWLSTI